MTDTDDAGEEMCAQHPDPSFPAGGQAAGDAGSSLLDGAGGGAVGAIGPFDLTRQEQAILTGFAAGSDRLAIAEALDIPVESVDSAVTSALHKLHSLSVGPEGSGP